MIRVGVIGATGYTGLELYRLLESHPQVEVGFVTSQQYRGRTLSQVFPSLRDQGGVRLISLEEVGGEGVDLIFSCLPHQRSMEAVSWFRERGVRVVDLSGDFRFDQARDYEGWYGVPHTRPELLSEAVYGLPEINRDRVREAGLVANPGCYPTGAILGLAPLLEKGLIHRDRIIVDAKSGVSGAGRGLSLRTHFVEANENVSAYEVGRKHRHVGEMEQELSKLAGERCTIVFTPHLIPMDRGILTTIYTETKKGLTDKLLIDIFRERYGGERFVHICEDYLPETKFVWGTNNCFIGAQVIPGTRWVMVVTAIDNLIKGGSGQAVQNMNLMFGFDEDMGLT